MSGIWRWAAAVTFAIAGNAFAVSAFAQAASEWTTGYNSRTRLVAGASGQTAPRKLYLGVEIALAEGWKTYWRVPGDSGGVPPNFDWSKSENLAAATVQYPAPVRLRDAAGDAIGYKGAVVLPVQITPADPAKPVRIALALEYGICREICVPAEAKLVLTVDAAALTSMPDQLTAALARVPPSQQQRKATDPALKAVTARLTGDKPAIVVEAEFPGGAAGADVFAEAADGIYLPMAKRTSTGEGLLQRFVIDLDSGIEPAELKGKALTLTLVSKSGQSEAVVTID